MGLAADDTGSFIRKRQDEIADLGAGETAAEKERQIVMLHESDLQLQKARQLEKKYKHALLLLDQERARITNDKTDT